MIESAAAHVKYWLFLTQNEKKHAVWLYVLSFVPRETCLPKPERPANGLENCCELILGVWEGDQEQTECTWMAECYFNNFYYMLLWILLGEQNHVLVVLQHAT